MNRKHGRLAAIALASCLALGALAGCATQAATTTAGGFDLSVRYPDKGTRVLGAEDGSFSTRQVVNATGSDITAISVTSQGNYYPESFIGTGEAAWANGEEATLAYTTSAAQVYNVKFTAGGKEYTIHDVKLQDVVNVLHSDASISDISIKVSGDLAYFEYEHQGETVSTLAHEQDLAANA